jgi:hypothetical protein
MQQWQRILEVPLFLVGFFCFAEMKKPAGFCRESGHGGDKAAAVLCGYWYFHEWTWFALLVGGNSSW